MKRTGLVILQSLTLGVLAWMPQKAHAQPSAPLAADIPIYQTVMQDHSLRYSIWVQVGSRNVEALLDTGSTGLRVLPAVVPGDLMGVPTETNFGAGLNLNGLVVQASVQIGPGSKSMPVEVIDHEGCPQTVTGCPVHGQDQYLISNDGMTGHGFSAIIGIGFSKRSYDIPNPLEALGFTRWIVELPMPDDPASTGHLLLDPDRAGMAGFRMAPGLKRFDFSGCLESTKPAQRICAPTLLDTGAPMIIAVTPDIENAEVWPKGRPAKFVFRTGQTLSFEAGEAGDPSMIQVTSPAQMPGNGENYVNAGVFPYYFYDVAYDAGAQEVGLRERGKPPRSSVPPGPRPAGQPDADHAGAGGPDLPAARAR